MKYGACDRPTESVHRGGATIEGPTVTGPQGNRGSHAASNPWFTPRGAARRLPRGLGSGSL